MCVFLQNKAILLVISAVYYLRNNNTEVLYICLCIITLILEFTVKKYCFMACRRDKAERIMSELHLTSAYFWVMIHFFRQQTFSCCRSS